MTTDKEFQINQFLSLRLESSQTFIYIAGELFIQCKFLLVNIPVAEKSNLNDISSIDDAVGILDNSLEREPYKFEIPPEVEFWGHCSNLQVWYEHDYDTRILHSNLAFALLGKLAEVGDPLAKKMFKSELIERYESGTNITREAIERSGALKYFSIEERLNLLINTEDLIALSELAEELKVDDALVREFINIKDRKVVKLELWRQKLLEFPKTIINFKNLEVLSLRGNKIKEIPEDIKKLNLLKWLWLGGNEISNLPDSICEMTSLEVLWLSGNKIHTLPEKIGDLINLKKLRLGNNMIRKIPESLCNLKSLEDLSLSSNRMKKFPESIHKLENLKWLDLSNNLLIKLPEGLKHLESLDYLDLSRNPLAKNSKIIDELKKLNIKKINLE